MMQRLDESLDLQAPAVLSYLAARLDAGGGLLGGLRTATVVARGKVTKATVASGKVSVDAASAPRLAEFMDDTGVMYVHVIELEITEDYLAGGGPARIAFPQAMQTSTASLMLPPIGEDLVVIAAAGSSALGREVARIASGAVACDSNPIFMPPELGRELLWWRQARAKPAAARIPEALDHLAAPGRLAVPALDVLLRAPRPELAPVRDWLRHATGPGTILARAVVWHAGDHDTAASGLDVVTVPRDWLQEVGLSVAESGGDRLGILGPARTIPLM